MTGTAIGFRLLAAAAYRPETFHNRQVAGSATRPIAPFARAEMARQPLPHGIHNPAVTTDGKARATSSETIP